MESVKDKLMVGDTSLPMNKNNMRMSKKLGANNAEITRLGVSNQKIKRRMGV